MKPIIYDITLIADKIGSQLQVNAKSGEHKSRRLRIQIVKDSRPFLPPIGATISLRGKHENGTMYLNTCALSAGRIVYDLGSNILATPGIVSCEVMIVDADNSVLYSPSFEIYVEDQLYTDEVVETEDEFTALTAALSRVVTIEASEDARVAAENARIAAETLRETAEDSRDAAEDERAATEFERTSAEELRVSQENARNTEEDARILAEQARVSQETARESAEDARESAELLRQSAEQERISNETSRVTAEQTRQSQETERQSDTATAIQDANTATDRANAAAKACEDIAGGNYPSHASTHAVGGSDPITPGSIGAAAANHTHDDDLVGEEYTIAIEPDGGNKEYSSIEIKENATGNEQVQFGTQKGFRDVISSWVKLCEGENSPNVELLHTSSGYNGLNIWDGDLERISIYYDASRDSCGFEICDANGEDVTLQTIGAAAAVHDHAIADVTGLQTALDGKQPAGSYAPESHTHSGYMPTGTTGLVGTKYTTTIEPDTADKAASIIRIKENTTGNTRVLIAANTADGNNEVSQIVLRDGTNVGKINIQCNTAGAKGIRITDGNNVERIKLLHTTTDDTCRFQINDASGNDVTLQTIGAQATRLTFTDLAVPVSAWEDDAYDQYADFPYQAQVACAGVTADMFAEVVLNPADAISGNYAPICVTGAGIVWLYAKAIPSAAITIRSIVAWM